MAALAGVRRTGFLGEARVRNAEAVVVPRVDLHVVGDGHVAGRALVARTVGAVMAVGNGVDDGSCWKIAARGGVAVHAELVAGDEALAGVRVVAIDAADAGGVHAA